VTLYGVIVLAVLAAGVLGYSYFRWEEGKALAVQQQALQLYQEAYAGAENPDKQKESFQKARDKFQEAYKIYGRGTVGQISQIYIGHCHYAIKEYDAAIAAYAPGLDGALRPLAAQSLGYAYEAKGDLAKALENFLKNADGETGVFQEEGLLGAARCYEALNQKPKALEAYQKALAKNPKSNMAEFIQWKVSELKG
jgi:tetratricopeptide (TPR) repeat protein